MTDQPNEAAVDSQAPRQGMLVPRADSAGLYAHPAYDEAAAEPYSPGLAVLLHALRRRWWIALPLGLLCAGLAAPAVWLTHVP